jgi:hypothetical protein
MLFDDCWPAQAMRLAGVYFPHQRR